MIRHRVHVLATTIISYINQKEDVLCVASVLVRESMGTLVQVCVFVSRSPWATPQSSGRQLALSYSLSIYSYTLQPPKSGPPWCVGCLRARQRLSTLFWRRLVGNMAQGVLPSEISKAPISVRRISEGIGPNPRGPVLVPCGASRGFAGTNLNLDP